MHICLSSHDWGKHSRSDPIVSFDKRGNVDLFCTKKAFLLFQHTALDTRRLEADIESKPSGGTWLVWGCVMAYGIEIRIEWEPDTCRLDMDRSFCLPRSETLADVSFIYYCPAVCNISVTDMLSYTSVHNYWLQLWAGLLGEEKTAGGLTVTAITQPIFCPQSPLFGLSEVHRG